MNRIARSKQAELIESAKLSFSQKLAMSAAASRSEDHLILSESFAEPVLEVIKLFNLAVTEGLFDKYALAGGLAVEYYGAPINTVDADFLVVFPQSAGGLLDASVFFEFFRRQGASTAGEYLVFQGLKFQMIPANRNLETEALQAARTVSEKGVAFHVVTVEHLVAMKLKAWRYKDRLHISHLLDSGVVLDTTTFPAILQRYQLDERWKQLQADRAKSA